MRQICPFEATVELAGIIYLEVSLAINLWICHQNIKIRICIALLFWNNFPNARSRTNSGLFQDRTFLTASQSRVFRTFDMLRQEMDFAGTHHIYSKRIALHLILVKFNSEFKNFTSADTSGSRIVNQTRICQK